MNTAPSTAEGLVWNSIEMALTQKISRKKSSESSVHPRNAATNVCRCDRLNWRKLSITDIAGSISDRVSHRCAAHPLEPGLDPVRTTLIDPSIHMRTNRQFELQDWPFLHRHSS